MYVTCHFLTHLSAPLAPWRWRLTPAPQPCLGGTWEEETLLTRWSRWHSFDSCHCYCYCSSLLTLRRQDWQTDRQTHRQTDGQRTAGGAHTWGEKWTQWLHLIHRTVQVIVELGISPNPNLLLLYLYLCQLPGLWPIAYDRKKSWDSRSWQHPLQCCQQSCFHLVCSL